MHAEKQLNQGMRIEVIGIIFEALCCICFGKSCIFCMPRRKMWWPWKELEKVTIYYPCIYAE